LHALNDNKKFSLTKKYKAYKLNPKNVINELVN